MNNRNKHMVRNNRSRSWAVWAQLCLIYGFLCLRAWGQQPEVQGNPLVPDTIADPSIVCFDGTDRVPRPVARYSFP